MLRNELRMFDTENSEVKSRFVWLVLTIIIFRLSGKHRSAVKEAHVFFFSEHDLTQLELARFASQWISLFFLAHRSRMCETCISSQILIRVVSIWRLTLKTCGCGEGKIHPLFVSWSRWTIFWLIDESHSAALLELVWKYPEHSVFA